jgi:hypothetical protein
VVHILSVQSRTKLAPHPTGLVFTSITEIQVSFCGHFNIPLLCPYDYSLKIESRFEGQSAQNIFFFNFNFLLIGGGADKPLDL